MTDQKSSGDTRMSTNITNVLWFPDMNHIHMVLQVILVNKEVPAYFTRNISSLCRNLVDHAHMLIIMEGTEVLVAEFAQFPYMRPPEMLPDFGDVGVCVFATLVRAAGGIRGVRDKVEDSDGSNRPVTLLHVLVQGCLEQGLSAFLAHLLDGAGWVIVDAF
jgi:hypothetical protein